ncbi:MAG: hypothetical protein C0501_11265 [Isosphaera sp.]|nr:hypothetical protein [Isosphaera sp.]
MDHRGIGHPHPDAVRAYAAGRLDGDEAAAVEEHLLGCDLCARELDHLTADPFAALLRLAGTDDPPTRTLPDGRAEDRPPPDLPPAPPGYEFERELGRGGMGVVFLARQTRLKRPVALKMILHPGLAGAAAVARFRTEAEAVARLQHPGIVQIHEVGEHAGLPWFSLEFCPGGGLDRALGGNPLPARAAAALVEAVARAVAAAHARGVVHRDLKPGNILLGAADEPKVADFGLARLADAEDSRTRTGIVMGTPSYMAPEQAAGDPRRVGPAADVYALGAVLYECLTGRPPFRGASTADTLVQVQTREPVAVRDLAPGVPRDLETVAHRCLQKDPARRYPSAAALADDLGRFLAGRPVSARPVGRAERAARWARRNPAVAALLGAVFTLLAAVAAVATVSAVRIDAARRQADENAATAETRKADADAATRRAEEVAERRRVEAYPNRVTLAWQSWQQGDLPRMRELLASLRPGPGQSDLRGFEWHYLWRLAHHRERTFTPPHPVRGLAVSRDGALLATGGPKLPEVWLWDTATGRVRTKLETGSSALAVAFSPDGRTVAASTAGGAVVTWDTATGARRHSWTGPGKVVGSLAYSPDGSRLAAASGGWTLRTGNPIERFLYPDHKTEPGTIVLWDTATGEEAERLPGHARTTLCLAFAPDGRSLVSGGGDGTMRVWDLKTRAARVTVRDDVAAVFAVAVSPDGRTVASAGWDRSVRVRDLATGAVRRTIGGPAGVVLGLAFTPDGRELVGAGFDRVVRRWNPETGQETGSILGHTQAVTGVAFGGGGALYTAGWDGDAHAWPAGQPQECARLRRSPTATTQQSSYRLTFSPRADILAASGVGRVTLYDVPTRRETRELAVPGDSDLSLAFPGDGSVFVAAGEKGVVRRWRTTDWSPLPDLTGHKDMIWDLAVSPDGRTLATGGGRWNKPGEVKLWDPHAGREVASFDPGSKMVRTVAFTPDGRTVAYGISDKVGRFDAGSGAARPLLPGMYLVAISPTGETAALGRASKTVDQTEVVLWDLATDRPRASLRGHTAEVYQMAYAPDGRTLATASWDGTVKLWHAATGEELLTFRRQSGVVWSVAFAPDNSYLAIGAGTLGQGEVTLWDARPHP